MFYGQDTFFFETFYFMMIAKLMKYQALLVLTIILYLLIHSKKFITKHLLNTENILENNKLKMKLEIDELKQSFKLYE